MHYNRLVACRVLLIDYIKSSRHTFFLSIYNDKVISPILPFTLALYSLKIRNHPYILCNISSFLLLKSSEYLSSSTSQLITVCTQRKICWSLPNKLLCDLLLSESFPHAALLHLILASPRLWQTPLKPPIKCCQFLTTHTKKLTNNWLPTNHPSLLLPVMSVCKQKTILTHEGHMLFKQNSVLCFLAVDTITRHVCKAAISLSR